MHKLSFLWEQVQTESEGSSITLIGFHRESEGRDTHKTSQSNHSQSQSKHNKAEDQEEAFQVDCGLPLNQESQGSRELQRVRRGPAERNRQLLNTDTSRWRGCSHTAGGVEEYFFLKPNYENVNKMMKMIKQQKLYSLGDQQDRASHHFHVRPGKTEHLNS